MGAGAAVASAAAPPHANGAAAHFGPFGGYVWNGHVRQVGTTVVIPTIRTGSPQGVAASWIGAVGTPNPRTLSAPFFQVGVNELRVRNPLGKVATRYYVFWSSTKVGFHPRLMFTVNAGDQLALSMTLRGGKWHMTADDETSGHMRTVDVNSGGASFTGAEWTQEDVTKNAAGALAPYPNLTSAQFSRMQVNSTVPRRRALRVSWMTTDRGTFKPTTFAAGGFELEPAHLTDTDVRYQQIAYRFDYAAAAFTHALDGWNGQTSHNEIAKVSGRFARAIQANITGFRDYRWPADIAPLVRQLELKTEKSKVVVTDLGAASSPDLAQVRPKYLSSELQITRVAIRIKTRLRLPSSNYSPISLDNYVQNHSS